MDLLTQIQKLRKRKDFIEEVQETDGYLNLVTHRQVEIMSEMPVPFCCPMAAGARAVFPGGPYVDYGLKEPPLWYVRYSVLNNGSTSARAHACPFCGTKLPKLVLKKDPPPVVCVTDGDYCGTCSERIRNCLCSHPYSRYEAENALPHFAVAAFLPRYVVEEGRERTRFLSVSRKNNHDDRGMAGGKIEPGETPREALVREVLEETGLTVTECHTVFDATDTTDKRCLTFEVTKYEGEISTRETGIVEWVPKNRLIAIGSTFEAYNLAMFHHMDPYNLYR